MWQAAGWACEPACKVVEGMMDPFVGGTGTLLVVVEIMRCRTGWPITSRGRQELSN